MCDGQRFYPGYDSLTDDQIWLESARCTWRARLLPNVQDEPRPWLARLVLLGARDVTAMVVGSGALLGFCPFSLRRNRLLQVGNLPALRFNSRILFGELCDHRSELLLC
jgi:hypothetical protein